MAVNNFNSVAPFYDFLSKLVFDSSLLRAQKIYLDRIRSTDKVLILGGGTGEILKFVPKCESLYFLDKSSKMIEIAERKMLDQNTKFIQADFFNWDTNDKFDVILCPFFLDCFEKKTLGSVIKKVKSLLNLHGLLIISDFDVDLTPRFLSKMMHIFFRILASLSSGKLEPIKLYVLKEGFLEISHNQFNKGVFSAVYRLEQ